MFGLGIIKNKFHIKNLYTALIFFIRIFNFDAVRKGII